MQNRFLLKHGMIVDPLQKDVFTGDLKINGKIIEEVAQELKNINGESVFEVSGKLIMPGLVDIHVHISHCPDGHFMLAKAGVTTALDVAGIPEELINGFHKRGCGLTIAFLYPLIPGETLSCDNPAPAEISGVIDHALKNGALGVKILGGHYPLSSKSTGNTIKIANEKKAWIAVHAGTIETPGNISGLEELVQLAENRPVHIAHINSYCRGSGKNSPLDEAKLAVDALKNAPSARSESYLALINGTSGKLENDLPKSEVTKRCLLHGGYPADFNGMKQAIQKGWARIHHHDREKHEIVLMEPRDAFDYYMRQNTDVMMSFAVNSPLSAVPLALAKNEKGGFIVDALATDGGAFPRNVTLKQGLCLVNFGALTLNELTFKASLAPARLMGLSGKGHLSPGADADVIVVDPLTANVELVICEGEIIVQDGKICGKGGRFVGREEGAEFFSSRALPFIQTAPEWLNE